MNGETTGYPNIASETRLFTDLKLLIVVYVSKVISNKMYFSLLYGFLSWGVRLTVGKNVRNNGTEQRNDNRLNGLFFFFFFFHFYFCYRFSLR